MSNRLKRLSAVVGAMALLVGASGAMAAGGAPTGGKCGGIAGTQCSGKNDVCIKPTGQCGVADAQGTCTTKPQVCNMIFQPVCGCDGKTYSNPCVAKRAGVSLASMGACKSKK